MASYFSKDIHLTKNISQQSHDYALFFHLRFSAITVRLQVTDIYYGLVATAGKLSLNEQQSILLQWVYELTCTTIYVCTSGISKLGQLQNMPEEVTTEWISSCVIARLLVDESM